MIRAENLAKRYGRITALRNVTLTLARDEVLIVLGPSGCGKTSLLRLIAGFERPDAGWIEIDDCLVSSRKHLAAPNHRRLGMIFQDLALWPHMSVFNNVAFGLRGKGIPRKMISERIEVALRQVALQDHGGRFPHQLSGGERQRLAIARALAGNPAYLLMDEPFSSLDPVLKKEMTRLLRDLIKQIHMGIVYVTHNLDEALSLGDRIVVMRHGKFLSAIERKLFASFAQEDLLAWYMETV